MTTGRLLLLLHMLGLGKDQQREGDCWLEDYQTLPPPDWDFDGGFGKYISISRPPSNLCGKVSLTLSKR